MSEISYKDYLNKYGETTGLVIKDSQGNRTKVVASEASNLGLDSNPSSYNNTTIYKGSDGKYTTPDSVSGISLDSNTGKISVSVPEKYKDDEYVTSYINTDFLTQISKNYKNNKDVKYQDPFDESKEVTTEEYVNKLNEALRERISALDIVPETQSELMSLYGNNEKKHNIIMGLSANDMVTMSATGGSDDSYVAIPEWMTIAYPAIQKLDSFSNGYVKASDFRDNFFNTENGSITEMQAKAIKETAERMLTEGEEYSSDPEKNSNEFAKSIAFQAYISGTNPILSGWTKHSNALEAAVYGGASGFAKGISETLDNLTAIVSLGNAKNFTDAFGEYNPETASMETPTVVKNILNNAGLTEDSFKKEYDYFNKIDSNAAGLMGFSYSSGYWTEAVAEIMLTQGLIDAATSKLVTLSLASGAESTAAEMAKVANKATSTGTKIETAAETVAANQAAGAKLASAVSKAQKIQKSTTLASLFNLTVDEATNLFTTMYGGTKLALSAATAADAANIVNSAVKATQMTATVQSALSILGNMVLAAAVTDKETLNKILTSEATESETKSFLGQVALDAMIMEATGLATGLGINKLAGTKVGQSIGKKYEAFNEKWSKANVKFTSKISEPYIKFRDWFISRKMAKKNVSNATLNANEAIKEAKYRQAGREYGATLETKEFGATGVNPITGQMSAYKEWKASSVAAENMLTSWGSIRDSEYQILSQFSNPEIEPQISQLMTESNNIDTKLLKLEGAEGKLSKETVKVNKKIKKETYGLAFSGHSKEVVLYANRKFDMIHAEDRLNAGSLSSISREYIEIKENYEKARENVSDKIANIIDTEYLPSLMRLEKAIIDRMSKDWKVFPESYVDGLRSDGNWGLDGDHYLRRVARKDLPKGKYVPFSHMTERDNIIEFNSDKIMEDDDVTWIGLGLHELIQEAAIAKSSKEFVEVSEKYQGLTPEILMSEKKTAAAGRTKAFKKDIKAASNSAMKIVAEDIGNTGVVRNKRAREVAEFKKQKSAELGSINTMDISALRNVMNNNKLMTTDDIVDENTFEIFKEGSTPQVKKIIDKNFKPVTIGQENRYLPTQYELYQKYSETNPTEFENINAQIDRINAAADSKVRKSEEVQRDAEAYSKLKNALFANNIYQTETLEYEIKATKKEKGSEENAFKYELNLEELDNELEEGVEAVLGITLTDRRAKLAIDGAITISDNTISDERRNFVILNELLAKTNKKEFEKSVKIFANRVVNGHLPKDVPIIQGNIDPLKDKVAKRLTDKFESAFADCKNTLESYGETVESETITELLEKYQKEMLGYDEDPEVIKAIGNDGEIVVKRVSPSIADLYKNRPVYSPMSTPMQILADMALVKRVSLTNLSPRSFMKQAVADPLQSFASIGAVPGTFDAMSGELTYAFGEKIAEQIKSLEPYRWQNIVDLSNIEGISIGEAAIRNINATSETQLPFTTMSEEALRQADALRYGIKESVKNKELNVAQKFNKKLQKISKTLGKPNDIRETYNRKVAGQRAFEKALKQGYNYKQAEAFRQHAVDNATTNFRQKHTIFNNLRVTTPYLTAGISGTKSFWKMFELDPAGITGRIFTGFVCPIIWFIGEILGDEETKKKYQNISESSKNNHLPILVNGEIVLVPVGEELGIIINPIRHLVEELSNTSKYQFWTLMMDDMVGLSPVDLSGFTDPDMWNDISGNPPSFLEVMENGTSKILAQSMPPVLQTSYMAATGRDLYTGNKVNTGYISIDDDGNATIMSYSNSQFAKALANIVGGDARVIEKVTSGIIGTTFLNVLDTITSAIQYTATGGKEGSLTTAIEKIGSDISKPFATNDYASLDNQYKYAIRDLWNMKEEIVSSEEYAAYNKKIAQTTDYTERQKLINKRNELMVNFFDNIESLVNNYRNLGGTLDKNKFSNIVSLMTFEDALRADKTYANLNVTYSDAYKQAMQTLYDMGVKNPEGISSLGYIYTDKNGNTQVKMWNPTQAQLISNSYSYAYGGGQGSIHTNAIKAIIDDGTENSLKKQKNKEYEAEQPYWDKYNSTGKLSNSEWDKIDELRKEYNEKVVIALTNYMDTYGAENILNNDEVIDYLSDYIKVPSSYEKIKNRYVSSGNGKLDKQAGFAESYIKTIFGVK